MKTPYKKQIIPSLTLLRCFECAARHHNFTLAAEELHLSQSAVSRQIKELEYAVGIDLFRRVGRRVVLTDAGLRFSADLSVDLERIRQTVSRAMATGDEGGALRIAAHSTFADRWLIPRLPKFEQSHPDIQISLATRSRPFDFSQERFELSIHYGVDDWPDASLVWLCDEAIVAVSSPDLIERYHLQDISNLPAAPLLHLETRPRAWHEWFGLVNLPVEHAMRGRQFDQFSMIITGALESLGAALIPGYLVEEELARGSLELLSNQTLKTSSAYFIASPVGGLNPGVEVFTSWIQQEVEASRTKRAFKNTRP